MLERHAYFTVPSFRPSPPDLDAAVDDETAVQNLNMDEAQPPQPNPIAKHQPIEDSQTIQNGHEPSPPTLDLQEEAAALTAQDDLEAGEIEDNTTADQDLEAALQEAVRAEADSQESQRGENEMEIKDSYAPDPNQLAPETSGSQREEGERSPSYSPVLERVVSNVSDSQSDADYEPPEAAPPPDQCPRSPTHSSTFSPAPAEAITADEDELIIFPTISGPSAVDKETEESLPQSNGSVPMLIEVQEFPKGVLFRH